MAIVSSSDSRKSSVLQKKVEFFVYERTLNLKMLGIGGEWSKEIST